MGITIYKQQQGREDQALQMKIIFATLWVTRTPYKMNILPFRYLSNRHYKNEYFL
jgi:hypothetical protein